VEEQMFWVTLRQILSGLELETTKTLGALKNSLSSILEDNGECRDWRRNANRKIKRSYRLKEFKYIIRKQKWKWDTSVSIQPATKR
jgi:hypothetical protein